MKRLALALSAVAMLMPAAAFAQSHHTTTVIHKKVIVRQHAPHHNHWRTGVVLPHRDRGRVVEYRTHRLRAPGAGRVWVRADDQYLLINRHTGRIIATATPR
ncbi:RcnB family protein [Pararhizobium mangrovi]|nr:RcnB family protein [Pararhizobium mangrovi]